MASDGDDSEILDREGIPPRVDREGIPPRGGLGTIIDPVIAAIMNLGVNIFSCLFGSNKKDKQHDMMREAYRASQNEFHSMMQENDKVVESLNKQRQKALKRLAKIKALCFQQAEVGGLVSLQQASFHLGAADKRLTRISMFWESLASKLRHLKEGLSIGSVYLDRIELPAYADKFKKSILRTEEQWKFLGRLCSDYVQASDKEIHVLYKFLSEPVDGMSADKREQRQKQLFQTINDDIDAVYP